MADSAETCLPPPETGAYRSETSRYRDVLESHCKGYGIDIGFGGDAIRDSAIRVDLPQPYANTGRQSVQLGGDCRDLYWFGDGVLDYVYSSHVLEDFDEQETEAVLREWVRVLKTGGRLILLLPDQPRYGRHCEATGQPYNEHHSIHHFSLEYVKAVAARLGNVRPETEYAELGPYSFGVVFEKTAESSAGDNLDSYRERLNSAWAERDALKLRLNRIERHPFYRSWKGTRKVLGAIRRRLLRGSRR